MTPPLMSKTGHRLASALTACLLGLAGVAVSLSVAAQSLVEGQHYERLDTPVDTVVEDGQIEITEAFWFGCQYCNGLQPHVGDWYPTLEDDTEVVKLPATMGGTWNTHAFAWYAAKSLGIADDIHADFFAAIHEKGKRLDDRDAIADFFTQYGVSKEEANEALTSFAVRSDVNRANTRMRDMKLMGVPALIIDGRYLVTPSSAGSLENMPRIAETLVDQVRAERDS